VLRVAEQHTDGLHQLARYKLCVDVFSLIDSEAMSDERLHINFFVGDESQKLLQIALLRPPDLANWQINAFDLINRINRPRPRRLRDDDIDFFLPELVSVWVDIGHAHNDDTTFGA